MNSSLVSEKRIRRVNMIRIQSLVLTMEKSFLFSRFDNNLEKPIFINKLDDYFGKRAHE